MEAVVLWSAIVTMHPARTERVARNVGEISGDAQSFLDKLSDLRSNASIANGRSGYIGNPHEQEEEDLSVLLYTAEELSGLKARFPWERI